MSRDFTFIDDIIEGVYLTLTKPQKADKKHALYNIGNGKPVELFKFIKKSELCTAKKAEKIMLPMQPGDVEKTWADVDDLKNDFDYNPNTDIKVGVAAFVKWYKDYYSL